jgi:S-disulfanyl-L-cysteine oxidoreductase SoxD
MHRLLPGIILLAVALTLIAAERKNVGRPATAEQVTARNITVSSTGAGLPTGSGTAAEGKAIYAAKCQECHGPKLEGNPEKQYPALAGGAGSLTTPKPKKTVGSFWPYAPGLWDYIHRSMPYDQPRTMSANEAYAVTAYVLFVNGIVKEGDAITEKTLPQVKMPNREGFVSDGRTPVAGKRTPGR